MCRQQTDEKERGRLLDLFGVCPSGCLSESLSVCLSNFHIFLYIKANTGETKVTANEQQVSQLQLQLHK